MRGVSNEALNKAAREASTHSWASSHPPSTRKINVVEGAESYTSLILQQLRLTLPTTLRAYKGATLPTTIRVSLWTIHIHIKIAIMSLVYITI